MLTVSLLTGLINFLGKGNRKVVSACVVNAIHLKFPEQDNAYSGFKACKLFLDCVNG